MNAPLRQSDRLGRLTTALGPDTLALLRFDGTDHLFNGAVSFPRDWWHGATFVATRANIFDAEGRAATDATANKLIEIIQTAIANPGFTLRSARLLIGHAIHYPELYGRQGTMIATNVPTGILMNYAGLGRYSLR